MPLKVSTDKSSQYELRQIGNQDWVHIKAMVPAIHAESRYRDSKLSIEKVERLFDDTLQNKNQCCFLLWKKGECIGLFAGIAVAHYFTNDVYASDLMFYVVPKERKTRAALLLVRAFERWAAMLNCVEISVGISTDVETEKVARFYEKLGYKRNAIGLRKEI